MSTEIVDFKLEHLDEMDMRAHEAEHIDEYKDYLIQSEISKTAIVEGVILTCWGRYEDSLWQVPSVHLDEMTMKYARATYKIVKELVGDDYVFTMCLDDEFHKRWMQFIGFERKEDSVEIINGHECVLYEINKAQDSCAGGVL